MSASEHKQVEEAEYEMVNVKQPRQVELHLSKCDVWHDMTSIDLKLSSFLRPSWVGVLSLANKRSGKSPSLPDELAQGSLSLAHA